MRGLNLQITRMAGLIALLACLIFVPGCSEDPKSPSDPGPTPIPTRSLLVFYPFNGNALDESGNDYNTTLIGEPPPSVSTFLTIGDNNYQALSVHYTVLQGMGDFTISVWGRITTLHYNHFIISGARGGTDGLDNIIYIAYIPGSSTWQCYIRPTDAKFGPSVSMKDLEWHHIVFVRNGSVGRFYIDNKEIGDGAAVGGAAINIASGGLIVGQDQDNVGGGFERNQSWAGDIDNYRIYSRALTRSEIRALYEETEWGD